MPHPFFDVPTPLAIGHRGCAGELPENTLASFARALEDRAAVLESDVHLTRDGVPVLIHDDDVGRTTDGSGLVRALDLAALKRLDAGYRFSPAGGSGTPERGRGHRIPSLAEALEALPDARFNLELKEDLPELVARTLEVVMGHARCARTLLTAADDGLMARLRERAAAERAGVALGASTGDVVAFLRSAVAASEPPAGPMALQVPEEFGGRPLVTAPFVKHAKLHGLAVHVWTVNEPPAIARLLDLGVDGIVSDFPARVVAAAQSRR